MRIKKLSSAVAIAAVAAFAAFPSGASAAHCTGTTEADMAKPGFSYFGTDHVQESNHAEGGNPGPHGGTSGASNCRDTTGSPSERAPGKNR